MAIDADAWLVFLHREGREAEFAGVFANAEEATRYADALAEHFEGVTIEAGPYQFGHTVFTTDSDVPS